MRGTLLVYGAYGYSGSLIAEEAVRRGLRVALAGRDRARLEALADRLGADDVRWFGLEEPRLARECVRGADVVLNCAGPFARTWRPLVRACLDAGAHYLDLTGEIEVLDGMRRFEDEARRVGAMLLPGVGFDVVPSDCLAARVAARLPGATRLRLAIGGFSGASRGTLRTAVASLGQGGAALRGGEIARVPIGHAVWRVDPGDFEGAPAGPRTTVATSWGDVATAGRSTGIGRVDVHLELPRGAATALRLARPLAPLLRSGAVRGALERWIAARPPGPDARARATGRAWLVAEARDEAGRVAVSRLDVPEPYETTTRAALRVAEEALGGCVRPGVPTPSQAYGPELVQRIGGAGAWRDEPVRVPDGGPVEGAIGA